MRRQANFIDPDRPERAIWVPAANVRGEIDVALTNVYTAELYYTGRRLGRYLRDIAFQLLDHKLLLSDERFDQISNRDDADESIFL